MSSTEQFENVIVVKKANVYFDGKCVSHTVTLPDGVRKSVGVVLPSQLTFNTGVAERMECVAGGCRYRLKGQDWQTSKAGESFAIPANSSFDIEVTGEAYHYVCHFE
ncbi:MAG TPA: pyrimidine/purine nucleoside phosphorylase [Rhodocyclaceae bacterium]|nr:pyrimidine/purine nucleoside phosphorylase [Rhodocyclaceae bacterium]